ncbi:hypothetical protein [Acrocarpospora catenulata]|uniref:hypothetical protein n=1 Tax=Acrocarpospora catenulata TaxID=2836182 RepID=UPI001BDA0B63|nr:hypothetical protein [Acrocarpospora catenulata]
MAKRVQVAEPALRVDGGWWLVHGLPLVTPLIGCVVFALLCAGARWGFGGDPVVTPLLALVFALIGAALTWFGLSTAGPRPHLKILVGVTGGCATAMLVLVTVLGWRIMWIPYLCCSLVVWALWIIWRGQKYAGATSETAPNPLAEAISAARVQFSKAEVDERGVVRAKVRTLPGGTIDDAQALVPMLSADARAVPGSAHLARDQNRDGVGYMEIATRDNLARPIPWPGVRDLLGSLPTDPFPVGEYQTGLAMVRLVGDVESDRSAADVSHTKVGGTTRAGKSIFARVFLASLMAKRRLNIIGIDLTKELQTFGPIVEGFTWVITEEDEGRLFMARLAHVIKGRTAHLAREGLARWSLRSSLNFLVIHIEESKTFRKFQTQYENAVADAGSAGIMFVSSTQDWIYRQVSTTVRKLHGSGICFGVTEPDDAGHVLPDEALRALGKDGLPLWGASKPGYCYIAGLGTPKRMWSTMARIFDPLDEQLTEAVRLGAQVRDPMDTVTEQLFGELYARRTRHSGRVWGASVPAPRPEQPMPGRRVYDFDQEQEAAMQADEENAQDLAEMRRQMEESRERHLGEDATADDWADVDPDLEIGTDVEDGGQEDDEERPDLTPEQAQRVWDELLDRLYRSGSRGLETSQLTEWLGRVGRSRRFLYRQTDRWADLGCIQAREDGGWDLVRSPLERAGAGAPGARFTDGDGTPGAPHIGVGGRLSL